MSRAHRFQNSRLGLALGVLGFLLLLSACASRAVIADLESDKAIIQLSGSDFVLADEEATRACRIHGKGAQRISHTCRDDYCISKNVLYACK